MLTLVLSLGFLVPATAACLYYLLPILAGYLRRPARVDQSNPVHTFAVLIPAHNEEITLPATLRSIAALDWPTEMIRIYVVADNCTDRTADAAEAGGAIVLVRDEPDNRGKGRALAFGLDHLLEDNPDVVLILDADCELNPGALHAFDAVFAAGAEVAQAAVRNGNPDAGPGPYVVTVGDALNDGLAEGLDRLGRSVPLRGTGMGFRRTVLERVRWVAFGAVEDAEYDVRLHAAGVRVRYCGGAVVSCAAPARAGDLDRQRRRWRAALLTGEWWALPAQLVRSKPLVLAHLAATAAVGGWAGSAGFEWLGWWAAGLVLMTAAVYLQAVARVGLNGRRVGLLLRAPWVVARLGWVTLAGLARRDPGRWDRAAREGAWEEADAVRKEAGVGQTDVTPAVHPGRPVAAGRGAADVR